MKAPGFFRFAGYDPPADGRPFNGLLAFLPHPESRQLPQGVLQHVAFEGNGFQWLEIKGRIMPDKLHIELTADSPRYWLLFQLAGSSEVYLPHAIRIADGGCFGVGSKRSKIPLVLAKGNAWLLLIGCKSETLPLLVDEFEQLAGLAGLFSDDGSLDSIVLEQSIDHVLRRRFQALEKMEYKPFGTPILLSEWLLRTLQHLHKPMQPPVYGQITLYHEALQYIKKHYQEDISKVSIAEALNVSTRTLNRAFENRPMKIGDFIHKLKLNKARELLYTTNRPIEEIARELNFSCPKYFSNRYRQHFFESPTEFRLQHKSRDSGAKR